MEKTVRGFTQRLTFFGLILFLASSAYAGIGQDFGFGSRTSALAGAGAAWGFDGFAAAANPAGLSIANHSAELGNFLKDQSVEDQRFVFSYGLIYMNPSFTPINNVVTSNSYTSDATSPQSGSVDLNYRPVFGQEIGFLYRAFPEFHDISLGITLYFPIEQTAYLDSGDTYVPSYVLYQSSSQKPQIEAGIGGNVIDGLHVGLGIHTAFSTTADGTVFVKTQGGPSTAQITASVKPKATPYIGFLYAPPDNPERYSIGLVVRAPTKYDNTISFSANAQIFSSFSAVPFGLDGTSALYYDPMSIELGTSFRWDSFSGLKKSMIAADNRTYLQLEWQAWSRFESPSLQVNNTSLGTCPGGVPCSGVAITPSSTVPVPYRNIFVPRIAHEVTLNNIVLRGGYAYRPSILSSPPDGTGNYLDPSKHELNAGVGFKFPHFLSTKTPCEVDVNGSYQLLVTQTITKTAGDETGDLSSAKIGAPGYQAGGSIYGGGVSLTVIF